MLKPFFHFNINDGKTKDWGSGISLAILFLTSGDVSSLFQNHSGQRFSQFG